MLQPLRCPLDGLVVWHMFFQPILSYSIGHQESESNDGVSVAVPEHVDSPKGGNAGHSGDGR
jgi:hypothetical protein